MDLFDFRKEFIFLTDEVLLAHVNEVHNWLGGQKGVQVDDFHLRFELKTHFAYVIKTKKTLMLNKKTNSAQSKLH